MTDDTIRVIRYLTESEMVQLLTTMKRIQGKKKWKRKVMLVRFVLGCGLRIQECADLRIEDCRDDGVLLVRKSKTHRQRYVKVSPELLPYFLRHIAQFKKGPFFRWELYPDRHLDVRSLRRWWYEVMVEAGIRHCSPHIGRHTYATWELASKRLQLYEVQAQLGHTSVDTTYIYLHSSPELLYRDDKTPKFLQ